jgi:predicted O-linked N-acetylglucosamine transferase (SPINDLY family)
MDNNTPTFKQAHGEGMSASMNPKLRKQLVEHLPEARAVLSQPSIPEDLCASRWVPRLAQLGRWELLADLCREMARNSAVPGQWMIWRASARAQTGHLSEAESILSGLAEDNQWGSLACQQLGDLTLSQGRFHEAFQWFSKVDGQQVDCRLQRAYAAQLAGLLREAADDYRAASGDYPDNANLWFNWGICVVLGRLDSYQVAVDLFRKACQLQPGNLKFQCWLRYACRLACDWRDLEVEEQRLIDNLSRALLKPSIINPGNAPSLYQLNVLGVPQEMYRRHAALQGRWYASSDQGTRRSRRPLRDRLRLGVISPDLCGSAVGCLAVPWLEAMAESGDELWAFSNRRVDDPWQKRARAVCHWHDTDNLSDEQVIRLVRDADLDILVDLAGLTAGGRPNVLAARPAPWQVGLWGFLNTTQSPWLDALVADPWMVSPEDAAAFSETVLRLPVSLLACTDLPAEAPARDNREQWGFSPEDVIVAAFNNSYKLTPRWLAGWLSLLAAHPQAKLWVYAPDPDVEQQLVRWIRERFPTVLEQVRFAPPLPLEQHQQRLRAADLFADTFTYNAGATAVGAIQAGLPVLTCEGSAMLGRMGASINRSLGLDELVAEQEDAYFRKAAALLASPQCLKALQQELLLARSSRSWGDPRRWAEAFRAACVQGMALRSSTED